MKVICVSTMLALFLIITGCVLNMAAAAVEKPAAGSVPAPAPAAAAAAVPGI